MKKIDLDAGWGKFGLKIFWAFGPNVMWSVCREIATKGTSEGLKRF